jgi:hypothetical protein
MSLPGAFTLYLNSILNADPENIYTEWVMSGPFSKEHPKIYKKLIFLKSIFFESYPLVLMK